MAQAYSDRHQRVIQAIERLRMHVDYRPQPAFDELLVRFRGVLLGGSGRVPGALRRADILRLSRDIERYTKQMAPSLRRLADDLLLGVREIAPMFGRSLEIESRPLFGALPLARVIPQDVHSVMDYASGAATLAPLFFARTKQAEIASAALGASVIGRSLFTDYRLSLKKLVPIEAHEAMDYVWGASCIAAPFVLGYAKKDRAATLLHVVSGAATILDALFTDYRAAVGRGRSDVEAAAMQGARIQPGVSAHADY